ncbi:FecCD family ABC transporter permease [Aegicerativicinus sediminis]
MKPSFRNKRIFVVLILILIVSFILNLSLGSVDIPIRKVLGALFGKIENNSWQYIIGNYRLPKAITAVLTGAGLGVSGLMMQTLFRNPLAGPFVLGISSGASLGVALVILASGITGSVIGGLLMNQWTLVFASSLGSFLVLLIVLIVSLKLRDSMALLIVGLMFGSITSALVSVLAYFSTAEKIQQYMFWGFGSLGNLDFKSLMVLGSICLLGLLICLFSIKDMNAMLLGENYAKSMGVKFNRNRFLIIISTSLLAGGITAFVGPIAFIGLAIPHIARLLFKTSNHHVLVPCILLIGAISMLICDSVAQLPNSDYTLPINAITSIIGAPVVIWLLLRKRKMIF